MAEQTARELIADKAIIHEALPVTQHALPDRCFELPTGLYAAVVGLFLGFIGVTAIGFASPGLGIPAAIFGFFILAAFGVPAIWTRLVPESEIKPQTWAVFRRDGIRTNTGHNTANQASIQVLMLPALIFLWGVAAVTIAALVV
jgi:hypothetical protein